MLKGISQDIIGNRHAELGELLDMRIDFTFAVELNVVIRTEVMKLIAGQNKVNGNENGMSDRHSSAILAAMRNESGVLSGEERFLVFYSRFGALSKGRFQSFVTGRSFTALAFTGALIIARADANPFA